MLTRILLIPLLLMLLPAFPAFADSALVMGVFPRRDADQSRQMFQPMADHLSRTLQREVRLVVPADFPAFWERLQQGEFHLVHYNQYHYIKAHKLFGHRAILMNEEHGRTHLRATILVPADSPIQTVRQLQGRKILFGGSRSAMVSHIMALDLLRKGGLMDNDYISSIALNPIAAVTSLYFHQADASSGSDSLLDMRDMPWTENGAKPRIIATSDPVAHLPWAVSAQVDENLADQIRNSLQKLHLRPAGRRILKKAHLSALRPASDSDYEPHRAIVARTLGEQY